MKHGGDLKDAMARYGGDPADWLDLSTGINPVAWPVAEQLPADVWQRLPALSQLNALLDQARASYGVPGHLDVIAAPGTQALIQWLPRIAPDGPVAIVTPTYSEHHDAWTTTGRKVYHAPTLGEATGLATNVVVTNPNNPDGRTTAPADIIEAAHTLAERGGRLIVDEAFADIDPSVSVVPHLGDLPMIVLRSFGKFFGLAGVRLGFAIARPPAALQLAAALGPWAVSGPALEIGRRALSDSDWITATRKQIAGDAARLDKIVAAAGLSVIGGTGLYRLINMPEAASLHTKFAEHRIWTRIFDEYPDWLRLGLPGTNPDFARLETALAAIGQ